MTSRLTGGVRADPSRPFGRPARLTDRTLREQGPVPIPTGHPCLTGATWQSGRRRVGLHGLSPAGTPLFEEVLSSHEGMLRRLARAFHVPGRAYPDFDDLYQEASIALWRAHLTCRNWRLFRAYARRVVYHALVDVIRHEVAAKATNALPSGLAPSPGTAVFADPCARLLVKEGLQSLPPGQARDFWAVEVVGWSPGDWAKRRGVLRPSITKSLWKARRALRNGVTTKHPLQHGDES